MPHLCSLVRAWAPQVPFSSSPRALGAFVPRFQEDLAAAWRLELFTDLTIELTPADEPPSTLRAHRVVLAARSAYFDRWGPLLRCAAPALIR